MTAFFSIIRKFGRTFWASNTMEIMERWAWYGLFGVLSLYLTNSTDEGALGFSQTQKGTLMGTVTALLYLLPLITGAIADRYGYKKVLIISFAILSSGYCMMGRFTSYGAVFATFVYIALGAALFKPAVSASVSKTTDEQTSSIGFGIFYMMVNIGGFIGPFISSKLRNSPAFGWDWVFYFSTVAIMVNFVIVILFYKDPSTDKKTTYFNPLDYLVIVYAFLTASLMFVTVFLLFVVMYVVEIPLAVFLPGYRRICFRFSQWFISLPIGESNKKIFRDITDIFHDPYFMAFLLIVVGFWTLFNQLFYTLPNFIDQWGDTSLIYQSLSSFSPMVASWFGTKEGIIAPEMMINLDPAAIVLFQVVVSWLVMRLAPLNSIIIGLLVCSIGTGLSFMTGNGWCIALGIVVFAFGEMAGSIKVTEYIGKVAPPDKTALYMGCAFLPVAAGNYLTGILSGPVYQAMADKISLLSAEIASRGLSVPSIGSRVAPSDKVFTQNDFLSRAGELMHMTQPQLTAFLWDKYHPSRIWVLFTAIGVLSVALLLLYDRVLLRRKEAREKKAAGAADAQAG